MAGLAPLSLTQRIGLNGRPVAGARAFFYEAATLTPLVVYQDYGLGTPHPHPVVADALGMFPAIFLDEADGFYRQRITTPGGTVLADLTTLPIIGPGEGGGGSEVPVDDDALLQTGDMWWTPAKTTRAGAVRCNGRTIGSATSGASERANADTEALYSYLWEGFANTICPVAGGRGVSAAADFAANKAIATIDMRGRGPFGLDDMGNSAASRIASGLVATGDETTGGSSGGVDDVALAISEMPAHDHGGATASGGSHSHTTSRTDTFLGGTNRLQAAYGDVEANPTVSTSTAPAHTHTIPSQGGGAAHNNMPPFVLGTWFMKL